jgi:hypothetical protein
MQRARDRSHDHRVGPRGSIVNMRSTTSVVHQPIARTTTLTPKTARVMEEFKKADDIIVRKAQENGSQTARVPQIKSTESRNPEAGGPPSEVPKEPPL